MLVAKALDVMNERHSLERLDVHVVAVGRRTGYTRRIEEYLGSIGLTSRFHFFHDVPYADLPSFYRLATAFVYPSRIEGFGIPMLEAITAAAVERLWTDDGLRRRMAERGREYARRFSDEKLCRDLMEVYRKIR